jgi:hypothetical protein
MVEGTGEKRCQFLGDTVFCPHDRWKRFPPEEIACKAFMIDEEKGVEI